MMAGEIGASVIVVKEIEVPPTIVALADKESKYTDPDTGEWTRKMRRRPLAVGGPSSDTGDGSNSATTTEAETDFSIAEFVELDDDSLSFANSCHDPTVFPGVTASIAHRPVRTNPSRPTAQSSPFIAPIDDDLALFSMEPEPAFQDDTDTDTPASGVIADDELDLAFALEVGLGPRRASFAGLEIAAVYKPRPIRHRARPGASVPLGPTLGRHGKRYNKNKERKVHPWHHKSIVASGQGELSKEEKALQRRLARDKKREEKRRTLIALTQADTQDESEESRAPAAGLADFQDGDADSKTSVLMAEVDEEANTLASVVDGLHASVDGTGLAEDGSLPSSPVLEAGQVADIVVATAEIAREPRLIVEALVVRKMSIEEATLDFGRLAII